MTEIYHQRRQEQIVKSNEDREFDLAPATDTNTSTILFSDRNQHSKEHTQDVYGNYKTIQTHNTRMEDTVCCVTSVHHKKLIKNITSILSYLTGYSIRLIIKLTVQYNKI